MTLESRNPYAPPTFAPPTPTLWQRACRFLGIHQPRTWLDYVLRGTWLIHYGVRFRLSPSDDQTVYAFIPWTNLSERRAELNVLEVRRAFAEVLTRRPELREPVRGRSLVIVMVPSYEDFEDEIRRVVIPPEEWERDLTAPLERPDDSEDDPTPQEPRV